MRKLEKLWTPIVLFFVLLLTIPLIPFVQSTSVAQTPQSYGTMRMTLVGKPESFNQLTAAPGCISCWRIMELEYAFGLPVKPDGSPNSAAGMFDWIQSNANSTIWYFNVRPDAKWSDGVPITSADINFTFGFGSRYIFGTSNDFIGLSSNVTTVQVLNSSETEFVLNKVEPNFGLSLASQFYFTPVPAHIWQGTNYTSNPNFAQDVTSGPFYHLSYDGGTNLVLKANPYYWNGPGLAEIDVNFVTQSSQSATYLVGNQTDLAQVDPDFVSGFQNNTHFGINAQPDRGILYLEYNITQAPFNNLAFRQAMAYAINTTGIQQEVYKGYATPGVLGTGTIPPSATSWHNPNTVQYQYNPTMAESLLKGQGFTYDNNQQLHYPDGTPVTFKIYTDTDQTTDYLSAQQVANYLSAIGMQITVIPESLSAIAGSYISGTGDIRSQMMVGSNFSPIFALGFLDIQPGFNIYFPWFFTQPHWILPTSAENDFNGNTTIVNTSSNQTEVQQAVSNIDLLNSQYLPLVVLGYPYTVWVYRTDHLTGYPPPNSITGFDMGATSLDPATFSALQYYPPLSSPATMTTQTSTSASSGGDNSGLVLAGAVIVVLVVVAGLVLRKRPKKAPAEVSPTA
ncbi:MAG: ABC transporter substrate-binding protein [Candidatus Bathyarchaeia archaeon]